VQDSKYIYEIKRTLKSSLNIQKSDQDIARPRIGIPTIGILLDAETAI
jgi:hypothetical protein